MSSALKLNNTGVTSMTVDIKVPPLGESVNEATIAKLYKQKGDYVQADEILVELETDKVTLEINAPSAGIIKDLKFNTGDTVSVGAILGNIDSSAAKPTTATSAKPAAASKEVSSAPAVGGNATANQGAIMSPAARKISEEANVTAKSGSGKDGRVTKGDMLAALEGGITTAAPTNANYQTEAKEERVKMSKLRKTIAQRLKDSQNTAAILTSFNEVDMSAVIQLRNKYKDAFAEKFGIKLGFMSFFIKAAVAALKEIPEVNAELQGDEIVYKNHYDISVAVGTEQGLVVPVVRGAENLSCAQIESKIAELAKRARDGKLTVQDMAGGTFTITNGGVYGSLLSTPIINPPQTGILGLHKVEDRAVVVNGEIKIRPMMYIALSYDHRLIDGREAVTFLVKVKEAIEDPQRLLLEI